jgi:hypothetical protein
MRILFSNLARRRGPCMQKTLALINWLGLYPEAQRTINYIRFIIVVLKRT